eukprot:TRINITY_DN8513_c0_g1_i1.p1 TRINITY_DN8513_c0_g1~~TRINITY_DN8513_c0_g1_i1.p1  ORF type:complete len:1039 (+),score=168.07 TRINITY_DN8513_c0_g1_i1:425-3541(+)
MKIIATTVPTVSYYLFAVSTSHGIFPPLTTTFQRIPPKGTDSQMSVFSCMKTDVLPNLIIRKGLVEDFDDLMPLLQKGDGVLTTPPEEFFLDETLENQNEFQSVLVAEDPETRQIIGLVCMSGGMDKQNYVTKNYNTDVYQKLRHANDTDPSRAAAPNSFQITFFYLNPDYENRADSFIEPAFAEFPTCEYCFISLPHTTTEHSLLHDFSYIPLKQGLTLPNGVWLLSRRCLSPTVVRPTSEDDYAELDAILESQTELSLECSRKMTDLLREAVGHQTSGYKDGLLYSFTLLDDTGKAVGTTLIRVLACEEVHSLRGNFELDSIVNFVPNGCPDYSGTDINIDAPDNRAQLSATMPALLITQFYVLPSYRNRIRTFIREVLRQTQMQLAFYCLSLVDEASQPLLAELILAMPRRIIEHSEEHPPDAEDEELLCLHFISKKQLSDDVTKIYARLVVIGASTTGLAAVYEWLKIPFLHIANIVMVSRDGIPDHPSVETENWSVDTLTWLEREYMLFRIGGKVRIIEGTIIDFERTEKYIVTDNGFIEPYDHLIITAGRQYSIPKELTSKHLTKNGMFELSNSSQIHKIKQHIRESEAYEDELSNAIIYGSGKKVYTVATSLTQIGLSPSRLVIVSPEDTSNEEDAIFDDPLVDIKVDKLMESLGAKTYKNYVLDRMDYDEDQNLSSVYISSKTDSRDDQKKKVAEIPATMFIYCHEKDIDSQILSALNKRSIVFDGRVIVKYNYRTTDPQIYAVGPIAMFSGRFGPSEEFESFNPLEVGRKFAQAVLGFIGVEEFQEEIDDNDQAGLEPEDAVAAESEPQNILPKPLPVYTERVSCRVQLPNHFHFFRCHTANYSEVAGRCRHLTSSNARGDNYMRVSIGSNKYIEAISYFGSEEVEVHNLQTLVGLPESLLNIVYAYEHSRNGRDQPTLDLLKYLRGKWTYALYYSNFPTFFEDVREKLANHDETKRLRNVIMEYVEKNGLEEIDEASRRTLIESVSVDGSETRKLIEEEMIKFLHHNKQHFPTIYYLPDMNKFVPPVY